MLGISDLGGVSSLMFVEDGVTLSTTLPSILV